MRRLLIALPLVVLAILPAASFGFGKVFPPVKGNPADKLADLPIESYSYDDATRCLKHPQKGTLALQSWLQGHAGGVSWGIMRCEMWGKHSASLHSEGRALDWHLDAHNARDRREAERIIGLMLAADRDGNPHALARRMGMQEIIWNCHAWFSNDGGMQKYSLCYDRRGKPVKIDDTNAHRNHIHFGMNWAGARMKTSFWAAH